MKKLFSLLALVLFVAVVRAANPSFNAFDANFFQVTGTGNNSIKIKTNAFTWLNAGGGGAQVWTNNAGVIQPVSTNAFAVYPSGTIVMGTGEAYYSPIGSSNYFLGMRDAAEGQRGGYFQWGAQNIPGLVTGPIFYSTTNSMRFQLQVDDVVRASFEPTAAATSVPYFTDTSIPHTSGNLLEVKNAGLSVLATSYDGGLLIGSNALDFWGALSGELMVALRDTGKGDANNAEMWMGILRGDGAFTGVDFDPHTNTFNWRMVVNNTERVVLKPTENDGSSPFMLSSAKPHTSGPLLKLLNTNSLVMNVDWVGAITPGASNVADIGSALLPYRTNYAKAFTVIGSQRTVAYSESGTIYLDADAIRLRGNLPLTTNVVIPLVATLNITNGLIMSVTGP